MTAEEFLSSKVWRVPGERVKLWYTTGKKATQRKYYRPAENPFQVPIYTSVEETTVKHEWTSA